MDETTARIAFAIIICVCIIVWLVSLVMAFLFGKRSTPADSFSFDDALPNLPFSAGSFAHLQGLVEIDRTPERVAEACLQSLRVISFGRLNGIYQIRKHSDGGIVLKKFGPLLCNIPPAFYFTDAKLDFKSLGPNTVKITYRISFDRLIPLIRMIALGIIFGIGLPTILIVGSVMWFLVIPSPLPEVRKQVIQTAQIFHALWPPFMYLSFYYMGRFQSKNFFEGLLYSIDIKGEQPLQ